MIEALAIWLIGYGFTEGVTGQDTSLIGWPEQLGEWVRSQHVQTDDESTESDDYSKHHIGYGAQVNTGDEV